MKFFKYTALIMAAFSMVACDDTTDMIGSSITNNVDKLTVTDATYNVITNSLAAGSVLSKTNNGIIGKVKDPETKAYLTADYMAQLAPLSSFDIDTLKYIKDANNGVLKADSCFLLVSYQSTYGDTLAPMKVTAYEMTKAMPEDRNYYSDYDPMAEGYVRKDNLHSSATYTLSKSKGYFKIYFNKPFTKNGVPYDNYGTYIMQNYEKHPEYFKSNYEFMKNICPGFYIKHESGITDSTVVSSGFNRFDGTEEVLQTNRITNDQDRINELAADESCTYLKSPAGIFTEVTLPVEDIIRDHEKDTLNTATVMFPRINNVDENNAYNFDTPQTVLLLPKDSLKSFFENGDIIDNRTSFYATYNTINKNTYTFSNISNLITAMYKNKGKSENWNKAVLVPITITTVTENSSTVISKMTHCMSLTSTRLVKGTDVYETKDGKRVPAGPIQIKVIYSKFKEN